MTVLKQGLKAKLRWSNLNNLVIWLWWKNSVHLNFVFAVCVYRSPETCESVNDTGVIYQAQIVGHKSRFFPYRCHMKPVIQISYRLDPTLTVMLSLVCDRRFCRTFSFSHFEKKNIFTAQSWLLLSVPVFNPH